MEEEALEFFLDFLDLIKKYEKTYEYHVLAGLILMHTFKMSFDIAPSREDVKKVADSAIQTAWEWHLKAQEEER